MNVLLRVFTICIITYSCAFSQTKTDSVVTAYKKAGSNKQRIEVLKLLGEVKEDMSVGEMTRITFYNEIGLDLARKLRSGGDKIFFLRVLANGYNRNSESAKALIKCFEGVDLSRKLKDTLNTSKFLNRILAVMSANAQDKHELLKALNYGISGLALAKEINDLILVGQLSYNLASAYSHPLRPMLDSARFYMQQSYQSAVASKDPNIGFSLRGLGELEVALNHPELGLSYYQLALASFKKSKNNRMICVSYESLSKIHQEAGRLDSAFHYAKMSYAIAEKLQHPSILASSAGRLSDLYKSNDELQSLRYYKISAIAQDSVNSIAKLRAFQKVAAAEQQRMEEMALQLKKQEDERRQTLQLIAIGIFISTFLVAVL